MIQCDSEIGLLRKVIIHSPDDGIEQVTPDKAVEYLFEDIVYLNKTRKEHQVFSGVLKSFCGDENVLDIQDLLTQILEDLKVKNELVEAVCSFENLNVRQKERLLQLPAYQLSYTLITGKLKGGTQTLMPPVSNFIFCRDIGVVIGNSLLITQAMKKARSRETLLCYFIYKNHLLFDTLKITSGLIELSADTQDLIENLSKTNNDLCIEGGDVMSFKEGHVLIGCSERTTRYAIEKVMQQIFSKKKARKVSVIEMPRDRYCMHLDTIFTCIDVNLCVVFEPLIAQKNKLRIKTFTSLDTKPQTFDTLKDLLVNINPNMQFVFCGGGVSPYAEREQWTDGCNLFALKPGVVVTYDRNERTTKAIAKTGYTVIRAETWLRKVKSGEIIPEKAEKMVITIPSNELSRARGGTHCLTFPILRDSFKLTSIP